MNKCSVPQCDRDHDSGGLCIYHYTQRKRALAGGHTWDIHLAKMPGSGGFWKKAEEAKEGETSCSLPECNKKAQSLSLCSGHYKAYTRGKDKAKIALLETYVQAYKNKPKEIKIKPIKVPKVKPIKVPKVKRTKPVVLKKPKVIKEAKEVKEVPLKKKLHAPVGYKRKKAYKLEKSSKKCSFEGCSRPHSSKGLCISHNRQKKAILNSGLKFDPSMLTPVISKVKSSNDNYPVQEIAHKYMYNIESKECSHPNCTGVKKELSHFCLNHENKLSSNPAKLEALFEEMVSRGFYVEDRYEEILDEHLAYLPKFSAQIFYSKEEPYYQGMTKESKSIYTSIPELANLMGAMRYFTVLRALINLNKEGYIDVKVNRLNLNVQLTVLKNDSLGEVYQLFKEISSPKEIFEVF